MKKLMSVAAILVALVAAVAAINPAFAASCCPGHCCGQGEPCCD
ncbi:MAG: hypothetical protein AB7P76_06335 [Candidatus Melainabacteria bacterium]